MQWAARWNVRMGADETCCISCSRTGTLPAVPVWHVLHCRVCFGLPVRAARREGRRAMKLDARARRAIVAIAGYSLVLQGPLTLAARQSQPATKPAAPAATPATQKPATTQKPTAKPAAAPA